MRNPSIPYVGIGGVRNINVYMADVRRLDIPENRVWLYTEPEAIPPDVPVVVNIGKPIVDMPGCVTVHKENLKQRSKNKMLVNDDPKGNTTLCDSGMPSFQPVDYQSQGLTWTTVVPEEPEPDGMDSEPPPPPEPPGNPISLSPPPPPPAVDVIVLNTEGVPLDPILVGEPGVPPAPPAPI